uniref:Exonuclease domain-containing protein n=1 Tax=Salix viminalis TaxID=40686 RepID=A0A6N2LIZ6_SALVM
MGPVFHHHRPFRDGFVVAANPFFSMGSASPGPPPITWSCWYKLISSGSSSSHPEGSSEIVFFDLETTVPSRAGQRFWVLEFGAIIVCPRKLVELDSYTVSNAPVFEEVADKIFTILNGRVWAGHNIQRFDCVRIKEAFAEIGRPAPVPVGMIDSLGVLTERFGRRAGNMKMATLAAYFGLGQQKHRSLDDVRMNLEVLKHCATESSLPSVLNAKWRNPSTIVTRSRSNGKLPCREENSRKSPPTTLGYHRAVPYTRGSLGKV